MSTRAKYAINIKDARLVYRTSATDRYPIHFQWVPDDVAQGILDGRLAVRDVLNAIHRKRLANGDFDWEGYMKERDAERSKMNVRIQDAQLEDQDAPGEAATDDQSTSVTLEEVGGKAKSPAKAKGKSASAEVLGDAV